MLAIFHEMLLLVTNAFYMQHIVCIFHLNIYSRIELKSDNNSEDESIRSSTSGTAAPIMHTRESASLRRGLFKKREKVFIKILYNHLLGT